MGNQTSKLIFPAKPDYISALRLAAAALAGQAGLNTDEIEHLKQLTSQAFIYLMLEGSRYIKTDIAENGGSLDISFSAVEYLDGPLEMSNRNVMRRSLLKSLTRECCTVKKGKVAASIIPGAMNGCQNLKDESAGVSRGDVISK